MTKNENSAPTPPKKAPGGREKLQGKTQKNNLAGKGSDSQTDRIMGKERKRGPGRFLTLQTQAKNTHSPLSDEQLKHRSVGGLRKKKIGGKGNRIPAGTGNRAHKPEGRRASKGKKRERKSHRGVGEGAKKKKGAIPGEAADR